jgi:uncharacterized membrane protein YeaQ/YmgE (transglycosylase-associated protein family)
MAEAVDAATQQQILLFMTTEHVAQQSARSSTIQEANGRAGLFLTAVSSATVALAFVGQVTQLSEGFLLFGAILLPCVYFIGVVTFMRAVQVAIEDMVHARGIARIRHYYAELAPSMHRYLIHSIHDDYLGMLGELGLKPSPWQSFMTTSGMVSVINGAIAGVFTGLVVGAIDRSAMAAPILLGIIAFAVSVFLFRRFQIRSWVDAEQRLIVLFPTTT